MKSGRGRAAARVGLVALGLCAGCAHGSPPPRAPTPAPAAAPPAAADTAPGAKPEERDRLLEAQWSEVEVRARREGGDVVSAIKLTAPKIRLFHAGATPEQKEAEKQAADQKKQEKEEKKKEAAEAQKSEQEQRRQQGLPATSPPAHPDEVIDLAHELRKITPLDVDHIDVLGGQVAFVDVSRKERPELWLHDLELSVENLPTRVRLTEGRPVLLTASGTLQGSGAVSIFITANPFEKGVTFSGRAAIVGLQTSELYGFIEPATGLQAPRGTIDIFVEFDCRNGELTGGVKPLLKGVEIRPTDKRLVTVLKAWVTDLAVKLFSDRVAQRNAVATVIPIRGTLNGPDVQLWPTIFGVLRNAFVEGLTSGFAHLPPPPSQPPPTPPTSGSAAGGGGG